MCSCLRDKGARCTQTHTSTLARAHFPTHSCTRWVICAHLKPRAKLDKIGMRENSRSQYLAWQVCREYVCHMAVHERVHRCCAARAMNVRVCVVCVCVERGDQCVRARAVKMIKCTKKQQCIWHIGCTRT